MRSLSKAAALAAERYYGMLGFCLVCSGRVGGFTLAAMVDGVMGWMDRWMDGYCRSKICSCMYLYCSCSLII